MTFANASVTSAMLIFGSSVAHVGQIKAALLASNWSILYNRGTESFTLHSLRKKGEFLALDHHHAHRTVSDSLGGVLPRHVF